MSQTNPLARAWKTTEGVVTIGLGTLISVLSGVDPSALPHKYAGILTVALAVTLQVSRSWVKANAASTALYQATPDEEMAELLAEAEAAPVLPDPVPAPVVPVSGAGEVAPVA